MNKVTKVMSISVITNIFLSVIKIITGILGKSGALIADGIHSFSDLTTDFVAIIGNFLSHKPADEKHPYGHGKIEYVTSIIISLVILILGFSIIYNASKREIVVPSLLVAIISFITIITKFLLSKYIIQKGREYQNNILLASGYESRTDVISSIVVFLSVLLMQWSKYCFVFKYADMVATILVGLLIIKIGFDLLKENLSMVLEEQEVDEVYLSSLKNIILEKENICHIDHLTVLKYGSYYKLVAEVSVDPSLSIREAHQYIHEAEDRLRKFDSKIVYVTIHANPDQHYRLVKASNEDISKIEAYYLFTGSENKAVLNKKIKVHMDDYYMIEVDGKKIGVIGYYEVDDSIFIEQLFIEQEYRHCETGTSILKNIMKTFPTKNIILWISKKDSLTISFYHYFGFETLEEDMDKIKLGKIQRNKS